jgi:hypothetical protein
MAGVLVDIDRWNAAKSSGNDDYFVPEDLQSTPYGKQLQAKRAGDILAAQVAAMGQTERTGQTLIGAGSGVEVWVPKTSGDNGGGNPATTSTTNDTSETPGLISANLPDWIGKYLGGAALFLIGLVLIALAVWATIQDNK